MTTRKTRRNAGIAAAVVLAVAAAITVSVVVRGPARAHPADQPTYVGGFPNCRSDPDTCDGGDRAPGGTIVVAVGKSPRGWNPGSVKASAGATAEELAPVLPSASVFLPSGKIDYNRDLLVAEPRMLPRREFQIVYLISPYAVWNDGTGRAHPVTAQDFVFAWRALDGHDKKLPIGPVAGYDQIADVVGSDGDLTVTVTLKQPYADWRGLFGLLEPYWFAAQVTGADPTNAATMTDAQLEKAFAALDAVPKFSAGPFMIKNVGVDGNTVEVPNPLWYGATKPTLTSITFRATDDRNIVPMQNNDIDVFTGVPDDAEVRALSNMPGVDYRIMRGFSAERLQFNTTDPFLRDGALREAVMDVVDAQNLIDVTVKPFFPDARRLYSHNLMPGQVGYQDITKQVDPAAGTGDLDAATRVLAAAGYTGIGPTDNLKTPDGRHVTFTLVHTHTGVRDQSSRVILQDLARLGITVADAPTSDLGGTLAAHRFGIVEYGLTYSPLAASDLDLWSTFGSGNFTGWGDPRSDQLLRQMARTPGAAQQAKLLNQQDQILTAAHVDLPLYQLPQILVFDSRYVNIRPNPAGYVTYNTQEWGLFKAAQ